MRNNQGPDRATALVLAPLGRDAAIVRMLLQEAEIAAVACANLPDLQRDLGDDTCFLVLASEALRSADLSPLAAWLAAQPSWSDLPVIVLTQHVSDAADPATWRLPEVLGNVTFVERPFHAATFVSVARTARAGRTRQYEAKALIEKLRANEERFRAFVTASSDFVYRMNADWTRMWHMDEQGLPSEPLTSREDWLQRYIHPVDRPHVTAAVNAAIAEETMFELEHRVRAPEGRLTWTSSRAVPIRDAEGRIVEWFGAASDITARKDAEAALRESESQMRSLFNAIDEGVMVIERAPTGADGLRDWRCVGVNARAGRMFQRSDLTGWSVRNTFPDEGEDWYDLYDRVAETGESLRIERKSQRQAMVLEMFITRILAGPVPRLMLVMQDVTERRRVADELARSEEQKSFLLRLSDLLAPLDDPMHIQQVAAEAVGEHLGVNRVFYGETVEGETHLAVHADYVRGVDSIVGVHSLAGFEDWIGERLSDGSIAATSDIAADERFSASQRDALARIGCRAWLAVPFLKAGRLAAVLCLHQSRPYRWSDDEVRVARDVAERTWAAVERAKAEEKLRVSEEQYRILFNSIDEGFCTVQVFFDGNNQPIDYRFIQVNPAFERQSGLKDPVGKRISDVAPGLEDAWYRTYGRIALTGVPERFELQAAALERWFDVFAFRIGEPEERRVAILFRDVSDRKKAEETQRLLLGELNHRVKNTLATVQSIVQMTLRHTKDPQEFARAFSGRVQSLARVHSILTDNVWESADLRTVIGDQLLTGVVEAHRLTMSGADIRLPPQTALHAALMLHELGTNAAKYGALSVPHGTIHIAWRMHEHSLLLRWSEQGGPPAKAPLRRGFGTSLIERTARSDGGDAHADFTERGVTWTIRLPLEKPAAAARREETPPRAAAPVAAATPVPRGEGDLKGRRVLVIEDEPLVAMDAVSQLEMAGAVVVGTVANIVDALAVIETIPMDGALLDANLNGDPVDLIADALGRKGIPFVFVTGYGRANLPKAHAGVPILGKPYTHDQLLAAVWTLRATAREPGGVTAVGDPGRAHSAFDITG